MPEATEEKVADKIIIAPEVATAMVVMIAGQIGDGLNISFQTHVDQNEDASKINGVLDKVRAAIERQADKSQLEQLRRGLKKQESDLAGLLGSAAAVEKVSAVRWSSEGRRGEHKLAPKEQQEKANLEASCEKLRELIGRIKADIAELEAKVA